MIKKSFIKTVAAALILVPLLFLIFVWIDRIYFVKIDSDEADVYYGILKENAVPSDKLMLNTGVDASAGLKTEVDRMKNIMGLGKYRIALDYHQDRTPPARIQNKDWNLTIFISKYITDKREQLSCLAHELAHIYVWNIDDSLIEGKDEEKLVDTSGIYLGMGIIMLNGLTDDVFFIPGKEYRAKKRFFGYLKPEQLGYLFARYCAENGILEDNALLFLGPDGRKYFNMGNNYIIRNNMEFEKTGKALKGAYWCDKCGSYMEIPLDKKITSLKCPSCSWEPKRFFVNRPLVSPVSLNKALSGLDIDAAGVVGKLLNIDRTVFDYINRKIMNPFYDKVIDVFKDVPARTIIVVLCLVIVIFGAKHFKYTALIILASYGTAAYLFTVFDHFFQRPRPAEALDGVRLLVNPYAASSGYIATFFAVSTVIIMRYPLMRFIVSGAMVLVALSGPYNGLYFPSDVLAGGIIGIITGYTLTNVVDREKVPRKKKKR